MRPAVRLMTAVVAGLAMVGGVSGCDDPPLRAAKSLSITSSRGHELLADVFRPKHHDGASPVVIVVHGGGWTGGDKAEVEDLAKDIALEGFVVVSVNYDTGGLDRFPGEQRDVQQWVRYVQQHADDLDIDPTRVGLVGESAGGTLAMMIGVIGSGDRSLPAVRAVASWSGASDLASIAPGDGLSHPNNAPPGCMKQNVCIGVGLPSAFTDYLGCTLDECPDRYAAASPINAVTADSAPMYLTAAAVDFIPFDQSQRMADALVEKGVSATAVAVPGGGHAGSLIGQALGPTVSFLQQQLG